VASRNEVTVSVDGREIRLSNLDKPLFPGGFTKGDLLDYYARVAPVMLAHLKGRPVTVKRFPDGVGKSGFIEKNVPRHAPEWIKTVTLARKAAGKETTEYVLADGLAALTWLANLAAIEFHTPMWRADRSGAPRSPDLIVFDLDPGAPASIAECCEVAARLRERLAKDKIDLLAKTSGSKGLQLYGRIASKRWGADRPNEYAHDVAEELEQADPGLVVSRMAKALRPGKVLIDWSQNNPAKTTVTPYSMRALDHPSVSTPVSWDEVEAGARGVLDLLAFTPADVLARIDRLGDLFAPVLG
jgi:bifunctional non-homologous end joining protein LigD